jgi:RNA-directed DNA polymerase
MHKPPTRIRDKLALKKYNDYLSRGVIAGDFIVKHGERTQQGGPLSPLLANIVLDELDKELEKRGLRFVRYADDVAIYVRSQKAAERVKRNVSCFITGKLKLVVNEEKSKVTRPWHSKYLGFRITKFMGKTRIGIHKKSLQRFRYRIREITRRKRGRSLSHIVWELNQFLRGWSAYFRRGISKTLAKKLDHWIRRRLRAVVWRRPTGDWLLYPTAMERRGMATCGRFRKQEFATSKPVASVTNGRRSRETPAKASGE